MNQTLLAVLLAAAFSAPLMADDGDDEWPARLKSQTNRVANIGQQLQNATTLSQQRTIELQRERAEVVDEISSIAEKRPNNLQANLAVSKSLASVAEAPRAIPYAERGIQLAERSDDPNLLREALLTGAEVYTQARRYESARKSVQRVLDANPRDKDALAILAQVKDRGTATTPALGRGAPGAGGDAGANPHPGGSAVSSPVVPRIALVSASSRDAQRYINEGWGRMKLDPREALNFFDRAVAADPESAAVRVERAKARLAAGDAAGAKADASAAISLDPGLGAAYMARALADRALGRAEAELVEDYGKAAQLDGRFKQDYEDILNRLSGAAAGAPLAGGSPASRGTSAAPGAAASSRAPLAALERSAGGVPALALLGAALAGACAVLGALVFFAKRRASGETPAPTPRP